MTRRYTNSRLPLPFLTVIIDFRHGTVGLLAVYTSAVVHCLYKYDLRSLDESKTILHQLYAVVADYISAFIV